MITNKNRIRTRSEKTNSLIEVPILPEAMKVLKKYGSELTNNNICDAFCMAVFMTSYMIYKNGGRDFNKHELECLKKFDQNE